jgi:phenylacetate-CoA ligase
MSVLQDLLMRNPNVAGRFMTSMPAGFWVKKGEKKALDVFHDAARNVRAYREFLDGHGIDPTKIRTLEDFKTVPHTTKASYFTAHKLEDVVAGHVSDTELISMSGGTTGEKSMIVLTGRSSVRAYPNALAATLHLQWDMCNPKNKVLFINALSLGAWMLGTLIARVFTEISDRFSNVSYFGPGADADRIIDVIEAVGEFYDTVMVMTYPTFLKEILHVGTARGIDWHALNLKVIVGGEAVDPALRAEILHAISATGDRRVMLDMYGGSEVGNPGTETAFTHTLTGLIEDDPSIAKDLFGAERPFAIMQHNPLGAYVEIADSQLVVTSSGIVPTIRLESKDLGTLIPYDTVMSVLRDHGIDIAVSAREDGWTKPLHKWPLLALFGRADYAVAIYGAMVSPLSVQEVFATDQRVRRFTLRRDTEGAYTTLWVEIELQRDVTTSDHDRAVMADVYSTVILERLLSQNFDFRDAYSIHAEAMVPRVVVHGHGEGYFSQPRGDFKPKMVHQA